MGDIVDRANDAVEVCTEDAVRKATGKSRPEFDSRFDGEHCVEEECGVKIPRARLALGKVRCVECQVRREKLVRIRSYGGGE